MNHHARTIRFFPLSWHYIIAPSLCLALVGLALTTPGSLLTGILGGIADTLLLWMAARTILNWGMVSKQWQGAVGILLSYVSIASGIYLLIGITPLLIFLLDGIVWALACLRKELGTVPLSKEMMWGISPKDALLLPLLACYGVLVQLMLTRATDDALGSPWLLFGQNFFLLFGIATALLIAHIATHKHAWTTRLALVLHTGVVVGVLAIVYKLGFGYDPFLHRAAQQTILDQGIILPRTPFYIGQYVSVVGFVHLLHLPLKLVDIALVPLITTLALPLIALRSFQDSGLSFKQAALGSLLLLLFPLSYLTVTTPFNFATLLTLLTILQALPLALQQKTRTGSVPLLWLTALAATATHLLAGTFAVLLCVAVWIVQSKKGSTITWSLFTLVSGIVIPLLLALYNTVLLNSPLQPLSSLWTNTASFLSLFQRPYYYIDRDPSLLLELIYGWEMLIPIIIVAGAVLYVLRKKKTELLPFFLLPIALLLSVYLISTWIVHPQLSTYEQLQFAERLRHLTILFILPVAIIAFTQLITMRKKWTLAFLIIILSPLATASWYLTHPQRNEMVHFPGYNVTAADMEMARVLETRVPDGETYVVLSNILTAAASIEQFGFRHYFETAEGTLFYYAIPSGGPLAKAYGEMLYEGQKRSTIDYVFDLTGADRVYFLVHHYWAGAPAIRDGARASADTVIEVGEGRIVGFEYLR